MKIKHAEAMLAAVNRAREIIQRPSPPGHRGSYRRLRTELHALLCTPQMDEIVRSQEGR